MSKTKKPKAVWRISDDEENYSKESYPTKRAALAAGKKNEEMKKYGFAVCKLVPMGFGEAMSGSLDRIDSDFAEGEFGREHTIVSRAEKGEFSIYFETSALPEKMMKELAKYLDDLYLKHMKKWPLWKVVERWTTTSRPVSSRTIKIVEVREMPGGRMLLVRCNYKHDPIAWSTADVEGKIHCPMCRHMRERSSLKDPR